MGTARISLNKSQSESRFARILTALVGHPARFSLEHQVLNTILLLGVGLFVIATITNYIVDVGLIPTLVALISGVIYAICYYLSIFKEQYQLPAVASIAWLIFVVTPTTWITNAGSAGGMQYYLLLIVVVIAVLLDGYKRIVAAVSFAIICALLLVLEHWYPEIIIPYSSSNVKFFDLITSLLFSLTGSSIVIILFKDSYNRERNRAELLLLNILPKQVIQDLELHGDTTPQSYELVTVLFTDFKGFTKIGERLTPQELIAELDESFSYFDEVTKRHNLEKIKTIGDAYMLCGGIPMPNQTNPVDCMLAAMEIQSFVSQLNLRKRETGLPSWEIRIGIHTGPLIAGIVGKMKFSYDVFGDTVNTASRLESSGVAGRINISQSTFNIVKNFFDCEYRGRIAAKNKGDIGMYFVNGILPELSVGGYGQVPNDRFYMKVQAYFKESTWR